MGTLAVVILAATLPSWFIKVSVGLVVIALAIWGAIGIKYAYAKTIKNIQNQRMIAEYIDEALTPLDEMAEHMTEGGGGSGATIEDAEDADMGLYKDLSAETNDYIKRYIKTIMVRNYHMQADIVDDYLNKCFEQKLDNICDYAGLAGQFKMCGESDEEALAKAYDYYYNPSKRGEIEDLVLNQNVQDTNQVFITQEILTLREYEILNEKYNSIPECVRNDFEKNGGRIVIDSIAEMGLVHTEEGTQIRNHVYSNTSDAGSEVGAFVNTKAFHNANLNTYGGFELASSFVVVIGTHDEKEDGHTIIHEVMHYADTFGFYSGTEEFGQIYAEERNLINEAFPCDYGKKQIEEYWAEAATAFVECPEVLQREAPRTFNYVERALSNISYADLDEKILQKFISANPEIYEEYGREGFIELTRDELEGQKKLIEEKSNMYLQSLLIKSGL